LNLTIDIGNTRTKLGIFNKNNMLEVIAYENINKISLDELIISKNIEKSIISTTTTINKEIRKMHHKLYLKIYILTKIHLCHLPINTIPKIPWAKIELP
jgi:type III pantothenate kinase